ncbi:Antagonist of MEN (Mitotic Exit Network) [Haplosporangium sp. Z 767]|nr:Antagonist of MEN (Mitotic Exit Network) [Haplosporangium sp. Z 767]
MADTDLNTDESGSCEECECSCEDSRDDMGSLINNDSNSSSTDKNFIRTSVVTVPDELPPPGMQSNSVFRRKKRSSSIVTTSSVASSSGMSMSSNGGRHTKSIRPGRAPSAGGTDACSHYTAGSSSAQSGYSSNTSGATNSRTSITSSIAGESNYYDLGSNSNHGNKGRTITNNQQYRQYFTGHGFSIPGMNPIQQEAMKRRLSFFKSVAAGGARARSSSRRGSAFSTKSQETAVNLTGINRPGGFMEEEGYSDHEYDSEDDDMDLDEDDDNDGHFDFDNNDNDFYDHDGGDEQEDEELDQGQGHSGTYNAMLTRDVELELYRSRHMHQCLNLRRIRQLRRRQRLLPNNNSNDSNGSNISSMFYRTRSGGCAIFPPPLPEYVKRPSPIQLPEILHLVFQFLMDLTPADDYSQREIYSCMLVSKQWYLVAQRTLWREIRFRNPIKLGLFVDLLKRTDTVECLGIERNHPSQQGQHQVPVSKFQVMNARHQHSQQQIASGRNETIPDQQDEEAIMSPGTMQKRLHERANAVKKIVLHKLKLIEDKDILPLTSWFHNLQIVEFYICEKLTDKIVVSVAENCPQLQQLLVPGCSKVTDIGISQIALHCPKMKHLDLRACSNVSDESLTLVARHCPELWHLNVGRVTAAGKVTGKSIVEIAKKTKLNTLGLAGCAMTDEAVIEIAQSTRSGLHRISLNSCPMLTSASIRSLMQLCPSLAVLEIKQCLLVTDMATLYRFSTKRVLVELCPELQKRLIDYKVELAAMNAAIQSNNIATAQVASGGSNQDQNHVHQPSNNNNSIDSSNHAANANASTPQPTTTTVMTHP